MGSEKEIQFPKRVPDLGKLEKPWWSVVIAADEGMRFAVVQASDETGAAVVAVMQGPLNDIGHIGEIRATKVSEMTEVDSKLIQETAIGKARLGLRDG